MRNAISKFSSVAYLTEVHAQTTLLVRGNSVDKRRMLRWRLLSRCSCQPSAQRAFRNGNPGNLQEHSKNFAELRRTEELRCEIFRGWTELVAHHAARQG
jgi:hypothetical protein